MSAQIIDGKAIAQKVRDEVAAGVAAFTAQRGRTPVLQLLVVGDDAGSHTHVRNKVRAAEQVGIRASAHALPADTSQSALLRQIEALNQDADVDAILVQLPLPAPLDAEQVIDAIDPKKDVDGLTPFNAGLLLLGRPRVVPGTPLGCLRLLREARVPLSGKRALVVGRSALVGKPIAQLLLAEHATVTLAHSRSRDLAVLVGEADVLVAAAGREGLIHGDWIKPGCAVIDVGLNRNAQGKLCGDVEFAPASERAGWITPVPGGVGPMTVAMLLANTLALARI